MAHRMTRWGVGPVFGLASAACCSPLVALRLRYPATFSMDFIPYWILVAAGMALIAVGVPFLLAGLVAVQRAISAGGLCTGGAFAACRHPVYAAWTVFLVPGTVLLSNSWIGLLLPPAMYAILRILVRREEKDLEEIFGDQYRAYKRRVPPVFPLGWLRG